MAKAFGDQLLKAGLVNRDQLNKAKKSKHKQRKQQKQKGVVANEVTESARRQAADKAARDRELNRQHRQAVERKAVQAQIRQLVEMNCLPNDDGDLAYNFQDGAAIKRLFVSAQTRDKLGSGRLAIARLDAGYEIIPSVVAEKIKLRDESCIVHQAKDQTDTGADDPYADYKVPDDLLW